MARGDVEAYREAEILAAKSLALSERNETAEARELAERAITASRAYGWFVRWDGGQLRQAYRALRAVDAREGRTRSRRHFGWNLAKGQLGDYFLISELPGLFEFLDIGWPHDAVLESLEEFVDEILEASADVRAYRSVTESVDGSGAEEAIARFLVRLLGLPAEDVSRAARRALSSYFAKFRCGFVPALVEDDVWNEIELEHLLIAIDVGSRESPNMLNPPLRSVVQELHRHESLAVRSVARRICGRAGWGWVEVRNQRPAPRVHVSTAVGKATREDSGMLVGGDAVAAWDLFKVQLRVLERAGIAREELESEFAIQYSRIEASHRWSDEPLEKRWRRSSFAALALRPRVMIGRAAAMRVWGRYALEGRGPDRAEEAYDLLFPLYDPPLELRAPVARPVEFRALDWGFRDGQQKAWAEGEEADDWSHYPDRIGDLHLIGEVSYFVRPEREFCAETRTRGVVDAKGRDDDDGNSDDLVLSAGLDRTYDEYTRGRVGEAHQIVVRNEQRMLGGAVYRWAALNTELATGLGWRPSNTDPFGWQGPGGESMVTSVYWRDGRTGVSPPRGESLGEGWCLLATEEAVRAIRGGVDGAMVHLLVRRQQMGTESGDRRWHLRRAL